MVKKIPQNWLIQNSSIFVDRIQYSQIFAKYEIFKKIINIKGSIVECGVKNGNGLMLFAKLCAIFEPYGIHRKIIGFDTFKGFPNIDKQRDQSSNPKFKKKYTRGYNNPLSYELLKKAINSFDKNRPLGRLPKIELVKGDATKTIPKYLKKNSHTLISLLYLDFDLYKPTKTALDHFLPRMPKGAILAFDELDNPLWPGETNAMIDFFNDNKLEVKRLEFDPYIGFAKIN